jgi:hypothetical protein
MPIECRPTTYFIGDPDILSKTCNVEACDTDKDDSLAREEWNARHSKEQLLACFETGAKFFLTSNHLSTKVTAVVDEDVIP